MSLRADIEERRTRIDDPELESIFDQALDNWDKLGRELSQPTVKHGSDTVNFESIVNQGLTPGSENSADTGESSVGEDVAFSTSFPVGLRYAEFSDACNYEGNVEGVEHVGSVEMPMVLEMPASDLDQVSIDARNDNAVKEVLGQSLNRFQASGLIDYMENDYEQDFPLSYPDAGVVPDAIEDEDPDALETLNAVLGDNYGSADSCINYDVFESISHDEVEGEFLQEVNTPHAEVSDSAILYVPNDALDEYREKASELGFEGQVNSIEARALVHEERMKDVYEKQGTVGYRDPAKTEGPVNFLGGQTVEKYDGGPEVIDISRVRGKPVYEGNSLLEA